MLDLPGQAVVDKDALIGGCALLAARIDATRLQAEVAALPASLWGSRGGRVGVHNPAEAVFLRGHAPAEGEHPIGDRAALGHLPYVREIIETVIPSNPQRCLLAKLPGGTVIAPHVDHAPYFAKTVRIHVPVFTHERAWMVAGGLVYRMRAGEIWALNNSGAHAVWNADDRLPRTHLICDFVLTPQLRGMLLESRRDLGVPVPEVLARVNAPETARG